MEKLSGYPYVRVQFTKDARPFSALETKRLEDLLAGGGITDLLVLSHGWNNDMREARALYKKFMAVFAAVVSAAGLVVDRQFGVLGVLWPSKKFGDEALLPGSGTPAALGSSQPAAALQNQLNNLKGFFDGRQGNLLLEKAKAAAREMGSASQGQAAEDFVAIMEELLTNAIKSQGGKPDPAEGWRDLAVVSARDLLATLSQVSASPQEPVEEGGAPSFQMGDLAVAEGAAAGIGDFFRYKLQGARNLLNYVTYYQMKERAGAVGSYGLHPLLLQIRDRFPHIHLHLIGHSFGARLVTAAVAGPNGPDNLKVNTLVLLQAAFSHYGLARKYDGRKDGFFRRVITDRKVTGPILISFTQNDRAVGLAYAIASRIANQVAAAIGGATDIYGGMGGNGALKTPEAINGNNLERGSKYDFLPGKVYNLKADGCITDHSDICQQEVARALLAAIKKS
jgi:hypothetical protein